MAPRYFRQTAAIDLADTHVAIDGGIHIAALGGVWLMAGCPIAPGIGVDEKPSDADDCFPLARDWTCLGEQLASVRLFCTAIAAFIADRLGFAGDQPFDPRRSNAIQSEFEGGSAAVSASTFNCGSASVMRCPADTPRLCGPAPVAYFRHVVAMLANIHLVTVRVGRSPDPGRSGGAPRYIPELSGRARSPLCPVTPAPPRPNPFGAFYFLGALRPKTSKP